MCGRFAFGYVALLSVTTVSFLEGYIAPLPATMAPSCPITLAALFDPEETVVVSFAQRLVSEWSSPPVWIQTGSKSAADVETSECYWQLYTKFRTCSSLRIIKFVTLV